MASLIPDLSIESKGIYSEENKENPSVRREQKKVQAVARNIDLNIEPIASKAGAARSLKAEPQNEAAAAIKGKKWDIFFQIFEKSPGLPLTVQERGLALVELIKRGRFTLIPALIAGGRVSEQDLGKAIVECVNLGQIEMVEHLLSKLGKGRLQQAFVDQGVNFAAYLGHLDSIKLLLASGELSETARGQAVLKAIKVRKPEIIRLLLSSGFIDEVYREKALKEAKKIDHKEIIEILDKI
ncbi:MAG: hypothetical protein JSS10_08590 [Verrucomicrobia bacterium]|nr:hypothetical protein [Verrucomicrobiota bacterium]